MIDKNSALDPDSHLNPWTSESHTCMENSVIMRFPPTREYRKGRRLWGEELKKLGVRNTRERWEHNPQELRSCLELKKGSSANELHPQPRRINRMARSIIAIDYSWDLSLWAKNISRENKLIEGLIRPRHRRKSLAHSYY